MSILSTHSNEIYFMGKTPLDIHPHPNDGVYNASTYKNALIRVINRTQMGSAKIPTDKLKVSLRMALLRAECPKELIENVVNLISWPDTPEEVLQIENQSVDSVKNLTKEASKRFAEITKLPSSGEKIHTVSDWTYDEETNQVCFGGQVIAENPLTSLIFGQIIKNFPQPTHWSDISQKALEIDITKHEIPLDYGIDAVRTLSKTLIRNGRVPFMAAYEVDAENGVFGLRTNLTGLTDEQLETLDVSMNGNFAVSPRAKTIWLDGEVQTAHKFEPEQICILSTIIAEAGTLVPLAEIPELKTANSIRAINKKLFAMRVNQIQMFQLGESGNLTHAFMPTKNASKPSKEMRAAAAAAIADQQASTSSAMPDGAAYAPQFD